MTRRFCATHELRLTNSQRRRNDKLRPAPIVIPVMLDDVGDAYTAEEWRNGLCPIWRCIDGVWQRAGFAHRLPDGYTRLTVRRLGMGPTNLRAGTKPTRRIVSFRLTEDEERKLRDTARSDGKGPTTWARDVVVAELDRRRRR